MKRFEYKIEPAPCILTSTKLNKFGEDGWELAAIHSNNILIFKRKLPKKTIGGPK